MVDRNFFVRYYETYASENADALGQFYADDVTLTSAQGVIEGKEALLGTYRYITAQFFDKMTPDTIIVDGDMAAIEITDRFEAKADVPDFLGRAFKKGETFTMKICGVYRVEGGKIRKATIYSGG